MSPNHRLRRARATALCLSIATLFAGPLHAERADRDKPVNVEADRMTVDDLKKESVFEGGVTMTQGSMTLRADRVVVRQDAGGFNYAVAYGKPVHFRQKREGVDEYVEGFAERMEYDGKLDKVQLFTNAQVRKGLDEVRGDYISYDQVTEFYQVLGSRQQAAAGTSTTPSGRVRAVIQPKKREDQPSTSGGGKPGDNVKNILR